jgi:MFS family permease
LKGAEKIPWPALIGIIATVSVFAIAQGLTYPLLSFILERQGHSAAAIGLSAAMMPVGLVASSFLIPPAVARFGAGPVALVCAAAGGVTLAAIGWTQDIVAWFPLRFLTGAAIGPLYVMSEVWIIALSPPERRGRILGIYASAISAGFALGPFSLIVVGTEGWPPFLVGVGAFAGCFLCLLATLPRLPPVAPPGEQASVRGFVRLAPVLSLCVAACAAIEQLVFAMLPVYGLGHGVMSREMSAVQTVLITGSIVLQMPLGMAAERFGARRALVGCILGTGAGAFALPFAIGTPAVWPFVFVWGALAFGIYTLALAELGHRFSGAMLVAGNAAFALMWGLGGVAGPPAAGVAMDAIGVEGMPITIGVICFALAAVRIARR